MSLWSRLAALGAVGTLLAGLGVVVMAGPAAAQAPPQSACTEFSYDKIWQTSTAWGRARERTCVEYDGTWVRGVVQFQIDWPVDCTVSVGIPPSAGGGCPVARTVKEPGLSLKNLAIDWNWTAPGGAPAQLACDWPELFFGNMVQGYKPETMSCYGPWTAVSAAGRYTIDVVSVEADVKDDGDPPRQLTPYTQRWVERAGGFDWEAVKA